MMKRALDHGETQGAHGTSTFTAERLDHIRMLFERLVSPSDSYASATALRFIHVLWETKQNFLAMHNEELRDHFIEIISANIEETEKHLNRLLKHKVTLEAECTARGITKE
jgi:hypothetical protein